MIVFLPKPRASFLLISVSRLLFETLGQYKEIAVRGLSEGQKMKVVGHYAIGIHQELVQKCLSSQDLNNPCGPFVVEKNWLSTLAAHC